jgi:hypothetical protein
MKRNQPEGEKKQKRSSTMKKRHALGQFSRQNCCMRMRKLLHVHKETAGCAREICCMSIRKLLQVHEVEHSYSARPSYTAGTNPLALDKRSKPDKQYLDNGRLWHGMQGYHRKRAVCSFNEVISQTCWQLQFKFKPKLFVASTEFNQTC